MTTKTQWLYKMRRCSNMATLDTITERIQKRLSPDEMPAFLLAVDHRKAEITMKKLYDKIPVSVWRYVK